MESRVMAMIWTGADIWQSVCASAGRGMCSSGLSICCLTSQGTKMGPQTSLYWVQSPLPPLEWQPHGSTQPSVSLSLLLHFKDKCSTQGLKEEPGQSFFLLLSTMSANSIPKIKYPFGVRRRPSPAPLQLLWRACFPIPTSPPQAFLTPNVPQPLQGEVGVPDFFYFLNPHFALL